MQKFMQYFVMFRERYEKLMQGRHGFDTLSGDVFILWIIVGFVNQFVRSRIVSLVALIFPIYALFRMFSKNDVKRTNENAKYVDFRKSVFEFFKMQSRKFKERKTHKYYRCKNCSAYLRVKRVKGEHTVVCPKCGKEIHVKIK